MSLNKDQIEELKNEVLSELSASEEARKRRPFSVAWANPVVTLILGVLVIFAGVQSIQVWRVANKLQSHPMTTITPGTASAAGTDALPDMVGGC